MFLQVSLRTLLILRPHNIVDIMNKQNNERRQENFQAKTYNFMI